MPYEPRRCADYPEQAPRRRRRRHRRRRCNPRVLLFLLLVLFSAAAVVLISSAVSAPGNGLSPADLLRHNILNTFQSAAVKDPPETPDWVTEELIPVNSHSRPGTALEQVNGIVIHYVGNPGTTAQNNRDYFASLAETGETSASSHYVIGLEGEIVQCVPLSEIAYCSNDRNSDTISIECCHPDADGKFTDATYASLVRLTAFLADYYELEESQIIRHYDVTGKLCPNYYVAHEDAWLQFKDDVFSYNNA